jgi:excinuclease ABC subunit A
MKTISIRGARTHNLRNIDLDLPRDRLIVITGLSGSGKSSLAFDTIYAEGQRRYVESLSAYARQFLSMMEKPDIDHIEGLSPAISIEQKSTSHNPRSTVGTVTEIYDYLRLLYARAGRPRCPDHGEDLAAQTISQMVDQVMAFEPGTRLMMLAPVVQNRKGEHVQLLTDCNRRASSARGSTARCMNSTTRRNLTCDASTRLKSSSTVSRFTKTWRCGSPSRSKQP